MRACLFALLVAVLLLVAPALGADEPSFGELHGQAVAAYQQERYDEAQELAQRALTQADKTLGKSHVDVATLLDTLAQIRQAKGDLDAAEALFRRSLAMRQVLLGEDHPQVAESLNNLAMLIDARGDLDTALALYQRAAAIVEAKLGPDSPDLGRMLGNVATVYHARGEHAQADAAYRRALAVLLRAHGEAHTSVAQVVVNLAALQRERGDLATAAETYARALAVWRQVLGSDHPAVGRTLGNMAGVLADLGRYDEADAMYREALALRSRLYGADSPEAATTLSDLGLLQQTRGDYSRAEKHYRRVLDIFEQRVGPEHSDTATALNNLGFLYAVMGDYARAQPLLLRALGITEALPQADPLGVAALLSNLALIDNERGASTTAVKRYERALDLRRQELGEEHLLVAQAMGNLATAVATLGDFARAEQLYHAALAIDERVFGPNHPSVATDLNNLAELHRLRGDYAAAEPLYRRALAIDEKALGQHHPEVATGLNNLALSLEEHGAYDEARRLYERAIAIKSRAFGADAPAAIDARVNLALLHWRTGRVALAVEQLASAEETRERHTVRTLSLGNEKEKRELLASVAGEVDAAISLHLRGAPDDAKAARMALVSILRRKGRALDAWASTVASLRERLDAEGQDLFDRIADLRGQLAVRELGGQAADDAESRKLRAQLEATERLLAAHSGRYRAAATVVTLEGVTKALGADATLVEIARYRPVDPAAGQGRLEPERYAAYSLSPAGRVGSVDLGPAHAIDRLVKAAVRALSRPDGDPKGPLRELDAATIGRLRPLLEDRRQVLFAPDGSLNLVPVAALVDEEGRYRIEQLGFTYLTSGRQLLHQHAVHSGAHSGARFGAPLVVAGPDFGETDGSASGRGLRGAFFPALPGATAEGKAIARIFPHGKVLMGAAATEKALKAVRSPEILHIASHGFFLEAGGQQGADNTRALAYVRADKRTVRRDNPLLRSGIALAGANRSPAGGEDGVLTAYEAAALDLAGTKLVVLSACDTGVGEVATGEGVHGLRRALVAAGAATLVMSLWKVDDAATRELMVDYYGRLVKGGGRSEALRRAQLTMLRGERSHPFYWASFIAVGDPRSLSGETVAVRDVTDLYRVSGRGCACRSVGGAEGVDGSGGLPLALVPLAMCLFARCRRRVHHRGHHERGPP